jgi:hypothetical protein
MYLKNEDIRQGSGVPLMFGCLVWRGLGRRKIEKIRRFVDVYLTSRASFT